MLLEQRRWSREDIVAEVRGCHAEMVEQDVVVEAGRLTCRDGGAVLLPKLKEARQRWSSIVAETEGGQTEVEPYCC